MLVIEKLVYGDPTVFSDNPLSPLAEAVVVGVDIVDAFRGGLPLLSAGDFGGLNRESAL